MSGIEAGNQSPVTVKNLKSLGKNELAKRLVTATKMLDKWMQGLIEVGARLMLINPSDPFFDSVKENSTYQMMLQRSIELLMTCGIKKVVYTPTEGTEERVVDLDLLREKVLDGLKENKHMIQCPTCEGHTLIIQEGKEITCTTCHGMGLIEKGESDAKGDSPS